MLDDDDLLLNANSSAQEDELEVNQNQSVTTLQ
jgi:hypothetical protein